MIGWATSEIPLLWLYGFFFYLSSCESLLVNMDLQNWLASCGEFLSSNTSAEQISFVSLFRDLKCLGTLKCLKTDILNNVRRNCVWFKNGLNASLTSQAVMLLCNFGNPIRDFSSPLREHSVGAASRMWFIILEINRIKHLAQLRITCFKVGILNEL